VSDEEWAFAAPYLTLTEEAVLQRRKALREVFDGLRLMVKSYIPWRLMPQHPPPHRQLHAWS
jgi:transposase